MDFLRFSPLRRFEAFLMYETLVKKKNMAFLFMALMIPGPLKFLFIFVLVLKLLPADFSDRRIKPLLSLPFSRTEIFVYTFLFGFSVIFFASVIGWALLGRETPFELTKYFVFYAFYFGFTLINSLKIGDRLNIPMIFLAFDLLSSFIAPDVYGVLSQYSPVYQHNQPLSLLLAVALLLISALVFVFGRREKW